MKEGEVVAGFLRWIAGETISGEPKAISTFGRAFIATKKTAGKAQGALTGYLFIIPQRQEIWGPSTDKFWGFTTVRAMGERFRGQAASLLWGV